MALVLSSWCGVSLWRWQRDDAPATSRADRRSRSAASRRVPLRGALPDVPGRRHQGRRFAPRQRGRGCTPPTQVPVVRPPVHHLRARRRGAAHGRQVRRHDRAVRPGQDRQGRRGRHQGPRRRRRRRSSRSPSRSRTPFACRARRSRAPRSASLVLDQLGAVDEVAYLRFASVYKNFDAAADFHREIELLSKLESGPHPAGEEVAVVVGERRGRAGAIASDSAAPATIRLPSPPTSAGATVRSSSSTQPASSSAPLSRGPPSACTNVGGRDDVGEPPQRRGEVDGAAAGAHDVDRRRRLGGPSSGSDQEAGAAREQLGARVDSSAAASPRRCAARARGRPVALGGRGRRADEDDVGGRPEGAEHGPVVVVAEPAGPPVDDGRCRRGWRSCTARPTGGRRRGPAGRRRRAPSRSTRRRARPPGRCDARRRS